MMGNALFMTAFIFVGPLPFVHLRPTKELIRVRYAHISFICLIIKRNERFSVCEIIFLLYFQGMMALAGLSYASIVVSSFARAQNRVLQMGFADDMNTYVMISGVKL